MENTEQILNSQETQSFLAMGVYYEHFIDNFCINLVIIHCYVSRCLGTCQCRVIPIQNVPSLNIKLHFIGDFYEQLLVSLNFIVLATSFQWDLVWLYGRLTVKLEVKKSLDFYGQSNWKCRHRTASLARICHFQLVPIFLNLYTENGIYNIQIT